MSQRLLTPLIIGAALGLGAPNFVRPAFAAPPKPAKAAKPEPKAPPKAKLDLEKQQKALESGDETKVLEALDEIKKKNDDAGVVLVELLLTRGASPSVLVRAIETLGAFAKPTSGKELVPYTQHRNADIRHAALRALILTKSDAAADALKRALRSPDPAQRSIAARGLGELNVRSAVSDLFTVLAREVPEAAGALGQLCVGDECERFFDLLGKIPFDVMEAGIVPILLRTQKDVSDDLKLKLIERLRRMATKPASDLIQTAIATFPPDGSPKVKAGLEASLKGHRVWPPEAK